VVAAVLSGRSLRCALTFGYRPPCGPSVHVLVSIRTQRTRRIRICFVFMQDHSLAKGIALPYGKQGIFITLDTNDPFRGTKEALNILEEVRTHSLIGICKCGSQGWAADDYSFARQSEATC
jgi:hypothetical protein